MATLVPIFALKFGQPIQPGLVTVGRYGDGPEAASPRKGKRKRPVPSLTCATTAGKVFVHSLHGGAASDVVFLNINKQISSLHAGRLQAGAETDVLVVGTPTDMTVYDVANNTDIFFKELPDGASAIEVGTLGRSPDPVAFVGGNCSIQGFDYSGEDKFWTVTGDHVCSLELTDVNKDGENELVVGSADFDLRVYKAGGHMIHETGQLEAVTLLCELSGGRFAFAMGNGSVGVNSGTDKLWDTKMKDKVTCICGFDINRDGVAELVTGWADGTVDIRDPTTGEVMFTDSFGAAVAGIVKAECHDDGVETLIACSVEGEAKGYLPLGVQQLQASAALAPVGRAPRADAKVKELTQRKQDMMFELRSYEAAKEASGGAKSEAVALSRDANVETELTPLGGSPACVLLTVRTDSPDTVVKAVMLFADGLFEGESFVSHPPPDRLGQELQIPLYPVKNIPRRIDAKILVGAPGSTLFSVREVQLELPRFSLFALDTARGSTPGGQATLAHPLITQENLKGWVRASFVLGECVLTANELHLVSLADDTPLQLSVRRGELTVRASSLELAGDIIQSFSEAIGIKTANSVADFPVELQRMQDTIQKADDFHAVRSKLSAEMASQSGLIKSLVVRAEDSRIMSDIPNMRQAYSQLYDLNRDLITAYNIRSTNHNQLLVYLREINQCIQHAGRLRVGQPKTDVIAACRAAIKAKSMAALRKAVTQGAPV